MATSVFAFAELEPMNRDRYGADNFEKRDVPNNRQDYRDAPSSRPEYKDNQRPDYRDNQRPDYRDAGGSPRPDYIANRPDYRGNRSPRDQSPYQTRDNNTGNYCCNLY